MEVYKIATWIIFFFFKITKYTTFILICDT